MLAVPSLEPVLGTRSTQAGNETNPPRLPAAAPTARYQQQEDAPQSVRFTAAAPKKLLDQK